MDSCIHARIFDLLEAVAKAETRTAGVRQDRIVWDSGYTRSTVQHDLATLVELRILTIEYGPTPNGGGRPPHLYRLGPAAFRIWQAVQRVKEAG